METSKKKIDILEHIIAAVAGAYYNINLTRNLVPGQMYQAVDGKEYNVNEMTGLPADAKFSEVIDYWGKRLSEKEKEAYYAFFDIPVLLKHYEKGETHVTHTYWTQTIQQRPMLAEHHIVMYEDEENGDILAISYIRDITEEFHENAVKIEAENLNKRLRKEKEDAVSANETKGRFLSSISHDIRTPLNGIQGMLRIADAFPDNMKKQKECRDKIWIASNYLVSLVNNVLNMNRLENSTIELSEKPFDLIDLLMEIIAMTNIQIDAQGLHSVVDWKPGYINHRYLIGSEEGISRILLNLNSNAIKYNKKGGTVYCRCKELRCDGETAWLEFVTEDTGIGMEEEFLRHAFEPYTQEQHISLNSINGVGLGLTIVKETVALMGGTIQVESKINEGTRYTIVLPFKVDHHPKIDDDPKEHLSLKGKKALLAEDNNLNMEIAKFQLEQEEIEVFTASNGKEAVEMFEASQPGFYNIILMDIMMPVMDGLEATRHIRSMNRRDSMTIPIVAMSANAFQEDVEKSLAAGLNEYLTKPLDEKKLTETMKKYLGKKMR